VASGLLRASALTASAIAGVLWTTVSPTAAFVFLAAAMILAVALIVTTRPSTASSV
jgi:hypothetical protein